ncbi:MAG: Fur family transcriptional regulator [Pseudomonadota bacterium]
MDSAPSKERIKRLLESHGVTPTSQRLEVGLVLLDRPCHLSADDLLSALRGQGARVSKATVYNTLNLFVERGLVQAVTVDPTRTYYDSTTEPHHHFYNVDSGELTDIPPHAIDIRELPELPVGTDTASVQVVVRVRNRSA